MNLSVKIALITHIACGFCALFVGLIPMFSKKGSKLHNTAGLIYYYCMMAVAITAFYLVVFKPSTLFLFCIAVFSFYSCFTGRRMVLLNRKNIGFQAFDSYLAKFSLLFGVGMIIFSVYKIFAHYPTISVFNILYSFFGGLFILMARRDQYFIRNESEYDGKAWFFQHIIKMGTSYIATITAFLTVNSRYFLPENVFTNLGVWILPAFLGGFIIAKTVKYYRNIFEEKKNNASTIISTILFFLPLFASSQGVVLEGKVMNSQQNGLEYVSIGVKDKPIGALTDYSGYFRISSVNILPSDSIFISMIGYQTEKVSCENLKKTLENGIPIILKENIISLEEISIVSQKTNHRSVGNQNIDARMIVNFALEKKENQNIGAEIGKVFSLKSKKGYLEEFRFYLMHNNFSKVKFRVNVYEVKSNRPQKNLLNQNIYLDINPKQTGWITVDMRAHNIVVTKKFAVSVEWIEHSEDGKYLTIPLTFPAIASTHLYKYGSQNRWKVYSQMSSCMNVQVAEF